MFRLFLFCAILGFSSCAGFQNVAIPNIERISKFEAGKLKDGKLDFSFTTEINNPDRLKFKIRRVNLDVMVNDIKVGEIRTQRTIRIMRLQHPEVKWDLTGDLKSLLKPGGLLSHFPESALSNPTFVHALFHTPFIQSDGAPDFEPWHP
jgi:LEA14-like dessication related protein